VFDSRDQHSKWETFITNQSNSCQLSKHYVSFTKCNYNHWPCYFTRIADGNPTIIFILILKLCYLFLNFYFDCVAQWRKIACVVFFGSYVSQQDLWCKIWIRWLEWSVEASALCNHLSQDSSSSVNKIHQCFFLFFRFTRS